MAVFGDVTPHILTILVYIYDLSIYQMPRASIKLLINYCLQTNSQSKCRMVAIFLHHIPPKHFLSKTKNAYLSNVCYEMSFQDLKLSVTAVFTTSEFRTPAKLSLIVLKIIKYFTRMSFNSIIFIFIWFLVKIN
jgi:hypothetical protein